MSSGLSATDTRMAAAATDHPCGIDVFLLQCVRYAVQVVGDHFWHLAANK